MHSTLNEYLTYLNEGKITYNNISLHAGWLTADIETFVLATDKMFFKPLQYEISFEFFIYNPEKLNKVGGFSNLDANQGLVETRVGRQVSVRDYPLKILQTVGTLEKREKGKCTLTIEGGLEKKFALFTRTRVTEAVTISNIRGLSFFPSNAVLEINLHEKMKTKTTNLVLLKILRTDSTSGIIRRVK